MTSESRSQVNGFHGESSEELFSKEYASRRDKEDPLRYLRDEFNIPTRSDLKRKTLKRQPEDENETSEPCTYLCGNSLGVQPKKVREYVDAQLGLWNTKGVFGHFKPVEDSVMPPWLNSDEAAAELSCKIVGAHPEEVAVMQTLTANLHFLMGSFYKPTKDRYKIIIETKAFPSDHFAVESQIRHHNLSPSKAMVLIEPPAETAPVIPTKHILSIIDEHAASTALLLLPGIQFYSGQLFDIKTITAYAQSKGIIVGWDLAHAAGNVPVYLHDWNVDFAAWCNYKYLNCGPGAMGALFVHSRHTTRSSHATGSDSYKHRLTGWWGSSKSTRFAMDNQFDPIPGAGGFQVSNPSALDLSAVLASLSVFAKTDMESLRAKSLQVTAYLEELLTNANPDGNEKIIRPWTVITPKDPAQRGAQLSLRLEAGMLDHVMEELEDQGVVVDERQPDVVRVAPAPIYNSFEDARRFAVVFYTACRNALEAKNRNGIISNGSK